MIGLLPARRKQYLFAGARPQPSFDLRFQDLGSGVVSTVAERGGVSATFTRAAATATTIDPTGLVLKAIGANVPRSYYDPTSLAYLGYLAEGARVNLHTQSEDSTNAAWTKVDTTPTISGTAPDGTATANLETEGSAGTALLSQAVTGTSNANYAVTRFLKRGNTDWVRITILNGANLVNGWFNLNTGIVGSTAVGGTGAAVAIRIKSFPSGWYRCELVGSVGSAATAITAGTSSASADASTTRVNNATYAWWGAGFEDNVSFASTYIPTVGATVTRNADSLTYPTTGWFNALTGTLFGQGVVYAAANANGMMSVNDGTGNNRIDIRNSTATTINGIITSGGVTSENNTLAGAFPLLTNAKVAHAYAANDANIAGSGLVGTADTSVTIPSGLTTLQVGNLDGGTSNPWFGPISRVAYFGTRLPNGQLQQLTN